METPKKERKLKKNHIVIIAAVIIAVIVVAAVLAPLYTTRFGSPFTPTSPLIESKPSKITPTIDGNITGTEYADATKITADSINAIVYIKNDNNFAYIAIDALNDNKTRNDLVAVGDKVIISVSFSVSNNQTLQSDRSFEYDFIISVQKPNTIDLMVRHLQYANGTHTAEVDQDGWKVISDTDTGSANKLVVRTLEMSWITGTHRTYEMKIPFQGEYGINATPGNTVRLMISRTETVSNKTIASTWPAVASRKTASDWATLKLAPAQ